MIRDVDSDIYANVDSDHFPLRITFKMFLRAIKKVEKEERINAKTERRRKLESLYPNRKNNF